MNNNQCICLEKIGDNGTCPIHGAGYVSGAASLFASATRTRKKISFTCQVEAVIGGSMVNQGDTLTARNIGNGLWAISGSWHGKEEFAHLTGLDVKKLAKMELVKAQ